MYQLLFSLLIVLFTSTKDINAYEINADKVEFDEINQLVIANGNIKADIKQYKIISDRLLYSISQKRIELHGNITVIDTILDSTYQSKNVTLDLLNNQVNIEDVYGTLKNIKVAAKSIKYNQKLYESEFITTSLCDVCKNGKKQSPFWQIRAEKLTADMVSGDEAKLENVYFDIFEKQVGYLPFFSLPTLWSGGKTGFLMPSIQNRGLGYQLDIPFYFKASKNFDLTLYPAIGKESIYGLNMRYKVENGGYEASIYTGSLPFVNNKNTSKNSIFKVWPANIKMNSNLFYPFENVQCKTKQSGYEFGITGEFAMGAKPILLYKYDISNRKIVVGNLYANTTYDRSFGSLNVLDLHNLKLNSHTISLPKTNIFNIKNIELEENFFSTDPLIITHIATNNIYDEIFRERLSDAVGEIKLMTKHYLGLNNKITYTTQLTGYKSTHNNILYNHQNQAVNTTLDIHWESKLKYKQKLVEPHLILHLEPSKESFFSVDQSQIDDDTTEVLSIYSTTNNINPNNIFSNNMYSTGTRSIMAKNGNHIDYGLIFSTYNHDSSTNDKLLATLGGRRYLSKESKFWNIETYNQDLSLAMLQDKFKERYVSQFTGEHNSFSITNRTWFTDKLDLLNNELYLNKTFKKLSTGLQYLFLNSKYNFNKQIEQTIFERFVNLKLKYQFSENWSIGINNGIKFGQDSIGQNITQMGCLKSKIEYMNECVQIGFTIKKEIDNSRKNVNSNVNSYNLYIKIPSI